jgi:hypothetical protein
MTEKTPRILFVYYTYTKQTSTLVEEMAEVLRGRGCDVHLASIAFEDQKYAARFREFPMPHPCLESEAAARLLDQRRFVAFVACRRYWKHNLKTVRRLGTGHRGVFVGGVHFSYEGGRVRSLLSLVSYLGAGRYRDRYLGVKIPPTNLREHHLAEARTFANSLADGLGVTAPGTATAGTVMNS